MKIQKQTVRHSFPIALFSAAVCLLLCATSCKKEKISEDGVLRGVMVDFANARQKAYIDPLHYSCFTTGESVRVNNQTKAITPLPNAEYRRCEIGDVAAADNYYAFYPVELLVNSNMDLSSGFNIQDNPVRVTVPTVQQWEVDNDGNQIIKNPMMSDETEEIGGITHLLFKNVCALWKISVSTTKSFDAIKISVPGCVMSGTGDIVTSGSGGHFPKLVVDSDTSHSVTMKFNSVHDGTAWGDGFYFVVPELTVPADSSITVEFFKGSNPVKKFKLKNPTGSPMLFEANKIHTLANFTFNVGLFSVSPTQKVVFAPGNLQWSYSALGSTHSTSTTADNSYNRGTWRFAEHQYDFIGADNLYAQGVNGVYKGSYSSSDTATPYTGWIDLFTWGGSGYKHSRPFYNYQSYLIDFEDESKLGDFDWGAYNTIYNPQTKVNDPFGTTWRTLSADEWEYLFKSRGFADKWCRYSIVYFSVSPNKMVYGVLIYPDSTTFEMVQSFIPSLSDGDTIAVNHSSGLEITKNQYEQLEAFGCAFIPNAGRATIGVWNKTYDPKNGCYWSYSADSPGNPYFIKLTDGGFNPTPQNIYSHFVLHSVRLAHDVK